MKTRSVVVGLIACGLLLTACEDKKKGDAKAEGSAAAATKPADKPAEEKPKADEKKDDDEGGW